MQIQVAKCVKNVKCPVLNAFLSINVRHVFSNIILEMQLVTDNVQLAHILMDHNALIVLNIA